MYSIHPNAPAHVGLPAELRQISFTPLNLIQTLTAGQLPEPQSVHTARREPTDEDVATTGNYRLPNVEIRESPSKGLGLYAVDPIPAYSRIFEDDALLSLATGEDLPQLWEKYSLLPSELRSQFDELSFSFSQSSKEETLMQKLRQRGYADDEAEKMARVSSRFQANAFKTGVVNQEPTSSRKTVWAYALFLTVARMNHSCTPNAHTHYRPSSGGQLVYSLRNIDPGEEIEISYFDITMPLNDRETRSRSWGFTCSCPACSKAGIFKETQYEAQLSCVHEAMSIEHNEANLSHAVLKAQDAIDIALAPEYSWLVAALPNLYTSLGLQVENARGPTENAREVLEYALHWECRITGAGSSSSEEKRQQLRSLDSKS